MAGDRRYFARPQFFHPFLLVEEVNHFAAQSVVAGVRDDFHALAGAGDVYFENPAYLRFWAVGEHDDAIAQ